MMKRLSIMFRVDDTAHAAITLTPDRSYYRFATDDSIEDGELAAVSGFDTVAPAVAQAALPEEGDTPLGEDVKMQVFVDNVLMREKPTEQSLRRVVKLLAPLAPEFAFLDGFCR